MSAKVIWEQFIWLLVCIALTGVYYAVSVRVLPPELQPGIYDTIGTIFGLSCVILTRTQNIWCWPHGLVSVVAMAIFYWNIGLVGQAGLQGIYFLLIQFLGWHLWLYGGPNKTEMKISTLDFGGWLAVVLSVIALTAIIHQLIGLFAFSQFPLWDASIVACSIVAQTLLNWKKIESWFIWLIPVNISTIILLYNTEAYMFMVMYIIYLFNASWAGYQWIQEYKETKRTANNLDMFLNKHTSTS